MFRSHTYFPQKSYQPHTPAYVERDSCCISFRFQTYTCHSWLNSNGRIYRYRLCLSSFEGSTWERTCSMTVRLRCLFSDQISTICFVIWISHLFFWAVLRKGAHQSALIYFLCVCPSVSLANDSSSMEYVSYFTLLV